MKLYTFRPNNQSCLTFCVMAGNVEHAWMILDKHIERHHTRPNGVLDQQVKGWGRLFVTGEEEDLGNDYYTVTESVIGDVLELKTIIKNGNRRKNSASMA